MEPNKKKDVLFNRLILMTALLIFIICSFIVILYINTAFMTAKKYHSQPVTAQVKHSDSLSAVTSSTKLDNKSEADESKGHTLAKNTNHNQNATSYAYKTAEVRQHIFEGNEYNGEKIVFLTFDDGVNYDVTPKILDVLKEHQVPATFFVIGKTLSEKTKPLLEREIREGHAIGIHSYTHDYKKLYPGGYVNYEHVLKEIKDTQDSLQELLGNDFRSTVWRYPGGHMSWKGTEELDAALRKKGIEWMDWNTTVGDAEPISSRPTTMTEMLSFHQRTLGLNPCGMRVLLMHDAADKQLTAETLGKIIEYYKKQGYKFGVLT